MVDYYVDDNEMIIASEALTVSSLIAGSSRQVSLGLSDLGELPGQSTWFINKVVFHFKGYHESAAAALGIGYMVAGVVRRDLVAGTNFDSWIDFQDVNGFPFKNGKKYYTAVGIGSEDSTGHQISMSYTWTPRKSLKLNREQDLVLAIRNSVGNDISGYLSIICQAKRGD